MTDVLNYNVLIIINNIRVKNIAKKGGIFIHESIERRSTKGLTVL